MKNMLNRYKPGASKQTHLLLTAIIWSLIGLMLMARAVDIILVSGEWWMLPSAAMVGALKSYLILDRMASRNCERILQRVDGACIGGAYSWQTWLLVLTMIFLGVALRSSSISSLILSFIYLAIGWALYWSSRLIWQQWQQK